MAADVTDPTITFVSVASPQTRGAPIEVQANASDDESGVARVDFYIGGTQFGSDTTGNPYSSRLLTKDYACGVHTLRATAFDNCNNAATITQQLELVLYDIQNKGDIDGAEWFLPLTGGHIEETSSVTELRVRPEDLDLLPENIQACPDVDYTITFAGSGTRDRFYAPPVSSFYVYGNFTFGNFSLNNEGFYSTVLEETC